MPLLRLKNLPRFARQVPWGRPKLARLALLLSLPLGGATLGVAEVSAQATFSWPDTAVDVSRYETVEECVAATGRVIEAALARERITTGVWHDTLPYDPRTEGPGRAFPVAIKTTAVRCMARFTDPATMLGDYDYDHDAPTNFETLGQILRMYLRADRDAEATAFVAQRIAAAPARYRSRVETMAVTEYRKAQPMRIAILDSIYRSEVSPASSPGARYSLYMRLHNMAVSVGDTARAREFEAQMAELWPQLPLDRRRVSLVPRILKRTVAQPSFDPLGAFYLETFLDTLRQQGTARYAEARAALFTKLSGMAPSKIVKFSKLDEFHKLVGQQAPAIVGDFWYRRGDTTAPRPTRGRVGLVVFIDPTPPGMIGADPRDTDSSATRTGCFPHRNTLEGLEGSRRRLYSRDEEHSLCWEIPAVLRRLAQRFPELEITAVTQTRGSFVYTAYPQDPAKEAEVIRHWLHDAHRMPGALAVSAASYHYRPEPDGRVVRYLNVPNSANYFSALGESWSYITKWFTQDAYTQVLPNGTTFLVDPDGTIVTALQLSRIVESDLAKVIEVVQQQAGATGRRPAQP